MKVAVCDDQRIILNQMRDMLKKSILLDIVWEQEQNGIAVASEIQRIRETYMAQLRDACKRIETGEIYQAENILKDVQEEVSKTEPSRFCQNMTVNAVLSEKQRECKKLGFVMKADIRKKR